MFALNRSPSRSGWRLSVLALCLGLGLGLAAGAWAQDAPAAAPVQVTAPPPPRGIGLGAILDLARANDAQYAAAVATAEGGREKLPQAQAANLPSINATYNPKRSNNRSSEYSGGRSFNANSAALTITQALIRPANWAGTDQGELQVQLAEQQLQLAAQDLLLRVSRGYFDVLQAQDDLAAAVAQQDAMVQQLAQTKRALEVGTVPITDFNEAQGRHDIAVAQRIAAANELESKKRVLERYIAQPLPPLARLGASANVDLLTPEMQRQLVADASSNALQVQIGRTTSQVAEKEISRREAGHYPTLDLVGTVRDDRNQNYGQFGGSNTREASIGVELTVPIYQGGLVSSRTREAIADRNRALQELSNAQRQATLDAEQAQLGVQSGSALTQALKQALISSETQLRSTQRGLQVGVRTRVDVLNAEQQLYATRKDLAAARYKTLVATLQLKAAAGTLADTDLRALDALLTD
ncbi:MAG: channel protein TolC [Burkholderiales bacterium PBB1]|nr:MAG: channel protein TolC [Burkholderiales bacterium PBB1]